MKRLFLFLCAMSAAVTLRADPTPSPAPPGADAGGAAEPQARSAALELAGAFSNDGYKIRDGFYFGDLEPGKPKVVEVNLFAGNEYWFCAAANEPARKIAIEVFDEDGRPVKDQQSYADGAKVAAGVVAPASGKYLVKVAPVEGEKSQFCFVYCYK